MIRYFIAQSEFKNYVKFAIFRSEWHTKFCPDISSMIIFVRKKNKKKKKQKRNKREKSSYWGYFVPVKYKKKKIQSGFKPGTFHAIH